MAVRSQEDGAIAQLLDDREESAGFVLGQEADRLPSELVVGLFWGHGEI